MEFLPEIMINDFKQDQSVMVVAYTFFTPKRSIRHCITCKE